MSEQSCILGSVEIVAGVNDAIDFEETPLGIPISRSTTIAAGTYYPDAAETSEDLGYVIQEAMNSVASDTFTVFMTSAGLIEVYTTLGHDFKIFTTGNFSDSVFNSLGFTTPNPVSTGFFTVEAIFGVEPPTGTWFPQTPDDCTEVMSDTRWQVHRQGAQVEGSTGLLFTRKWGEIFTRTIRYGPIDGASAGATSYDIDWATECFQDHWSRGKNVRVFTNTQTVTTAKDDEDVFDAIITNERFEPARYQGFEEIDYWEVSLDFQRFV